MTTPETGDRSGIFLITTLSGSRYRLDLDKMTAARYPEVDDDNALRQDSIERPLINLVRPEIGRPMTLVLDIRGDGIPTVRVTNWVSAIERIG